MVIKIKSPTSGRVTLGKLPISYGDIVKGVDQGMCLSNTNTNTMFGMNLSYGSGKHDYPIVNPSTEWKVVDIKANYCWEAVILLVSRDYKYIVVVQDIRSCPINQFFSTVVRRDKLHNKEYIEINSKY